MAHFNPHPRPLPFEGEGSRISRSWRRIITRTLLKKVPLPTVLGGSRCGRKGRGRKTKGFGLAGRLENGALPWKSRSHPMRKHYSLQQPPPGFPGHSLRRAPIRIRFQPPQRIDALGGVYDAPLRPHRPQASVDNRPCSWKNRKTAQP